MKKIIVLVFSLVIILAALPTATFAYSGGLLNGLPVILGSDQLHTTSAVTNVTDNDESTGTQLAINDADNSKGNDYVWYEFTNPVSIDGFKLARGASARVLMYNTSGNIIFNSTETGVSLSGVMKTISMVTGVKKVSVNNAASNQTVMTVYEFDVYNSNQVTDTTPPAVPMGLVAESGQDSSVPLSWNAVTTPDLAGYKIYIDGVYANTLPATQTSYIVHGLTNGIQYSFQISAFDSQLPSNESLKSTEATATPKAPTVNRALLVVTLVNGLEKEYDLSMTEVNAFITWYNGRAEETGSEVYAFNKTFNLANFLSRKDYIAFSKIETFEVSEYEVTAP